MFTTHTISQMVYLDPVVFIQQQVFRLDVSVDDVLRVYCSVCSVCVHLCSVCVVYICVCVCACVSVKFRLQVRPHVHTEA